jgi:hypothetical protein
VSRHEHDPRPRTTPPRPEELQWVDDEFAVPSEELLVWLDGELSDPDRDRLRTSLSNRRAVRKALWRAAPGRTSWRLLDEHRGLVLLGAVVVLLVAVVAARPATSKAAAALRAAEFARADALLDPGQDTLGWTQGGSVLRSSPENADERRPRAPWGVVLRTRPRFEWADAVPREVRVFDFEGRELWSWRGSALHVDYDAAAPLSEGERYRATVSLDGERRQPLGLVFTVADSERRRAVESALELAGARAQGDELSLRFARAAALARAGLHGEAGREIELLARGLDAPSRSRLVEFLLERSVPQLAERAANSR